MKNKLIFTLLCIIILLLTIASALAENITKWGITPDNRGWLSGTKGTSAYALNWTDFGVGDNIPLIFDLNNDGANEIIQNRNNYIRVYTLNGTYIDEININNDNHITAYDSDNCINGKALYLLRTPPGSVSEICLDGNTLSVAWDCNNSINPSTSSAYNDSGAAVKRINGNIYSVFVQYSITYNNDAIVWCNHTDKTFHNGPLGAGNFLQKIGVPAFGNPYNDGYVWVAISSNATNVFLYNILNNTLNNFAITGGSLSLPEYGSATWAFAPMFVQRGSGYPDDIVVPYFRHHFTQYYVYNWYNMDYWYGSSVGLTYKTQFNPAPPGTNAEHYSATYPVQLGTNGDMCGAFPNSNYFVCVDPTTKNYTYNQTFVDVQIPSSFYPPQYYKMQAADMNNDGYADFLFPYLINTTNATTSGAFICYYNGHNNPLNCTRVGDAGSWLIGADADNDGYRDIVLLDTTNDVFRAFLTNGTGGGSPATCSDTDKTAYPTINYTLKGTLTYGNSSPLNDFCVNDMLYEYYCPSAITAGATITRNCTTYNSTCQNGACVPLDFGASSRYYFDDFFAYNTSLWQHWFNGTTNHTIYSSLLRISGNDGSHLEYTMIDNAQQTDHGYIKSQYAISIINDSSAATEFGMGDSTTGQNCGVQLFCFQNTSTTFYCGLWSPSYGGFVLPFFNTDTSIHETQIEFYRNTTANKYSLFYDSNYLGQYVETNASCMNVSLYPTLGVLRSAGSTGLVTSDWYNFAYSITSSPTPINCSDSDGGLNFNTLGTVTRTTSNGTTYSQDRCVNDWMLAEYWCDNTTASVNYKPCRCVGGVCINYGTCNDSDYDGSYPTINPYTYGEVVVSPNTTFRDTCLPNDVLKEYYCSASDNMLASASNEIDCKSNFFVCQNGACVRPNECVSNPPVFSYPIIWYDTFDYNDSITSHGWFGYPFIIGGSLDWPVCNKLFYDRDKSSDEIYFKTPAITENFTFRFDLKPMPYETETDYTPYAAPVYLYLKSLNGTIGLKFRWANTGKIEYWDKDGVRREITGWGNYNESQGTDYVIIVYPENHTFNFYYTNKTDSLSYTIGCENCTYNNSFNSFGWFGFKPDFSNTDYGFMLDTTKVTLGVAEEGAGNFCPQSDSNCLFYDQFNYTDSTANHKWYSYATIPVNSQYASVVYSNMNFDHVITPFAWGSGDGIVTFQFNALLNKAPTNQDNIIVYAKSTDGTTVLLIEFTDLIYRTLNNNSATSISPYPFDNWATYSFVMNTNTNTFTLYIDSVAKATNKPLFFTGDSVGRIGFLVLNSSRSMQLNYVKVYKGQAFVNSFIAESIGDDGVNPADLQNCWSSTNGSFDWTCCTDEENATKSMLCPARVTFRFFLGSVTSFVLNNFMYFLVILIVFVLITPYIVPSLRRQ